jgi:hypothetical protein
MRELVHMEEIVKANSSSRENAVQSGCYGNKQEFVAVTVQKESLRFDVLTALTP